MRARLKQLEILEVRQARTIIEEHGRAWAEICAWIAAHATDAQRAAFSALEQLEDPEQGLTAEQCAAIDSIEVPAELKQRMERVEGDWDRVIGDGPRSIPLLRQVLKGWTPPAWITSP